jgi:Sec7-like guanine-nucleotide exchange factor
MELLIHLCFNRDPFCHRVLKNYLDYFDFTDLKLDEAFR